MTELTSSSPKTKVEDLDCETSPINKGTPCSSSMVNRHNEQLKLLLVDLNIDEICEWANCKNLKALRYMRRGKYEDAIFIFSDIMKGLDSSSALAEENKEIQSFKDELKTAVLFNSVRCYKEKKDIANAWHTNEKVLAISPKMVEAQQMKKTLEKIIEENSLKSFIIEVKDLNKDEPIPPVCKSVDIRLKIDEELSSNNDSTLSIEEEKILYYNDDQDNIVKMGLFKIIFSPLKTSFAFLKKTLLRCKKRQSSYMTNKEDENN